jgi:hypothetical protein
MRRVVESEEVGHELPAAPAIAVVGTEAKIGVLEARAGQSVALFHPADRCGPRPDLLDRPPALPLPEVEYRLPPNRAQLCVTTFWSFLREFSPL